MKSRVLGMICAGLVVIAGPVAFAGTLTCEDCGPGPAWVDGCPEGNDDMPSAAEVGIYADPLCEGPSDDYVLRGPVSVRRENSLGTEIVTEIMEMELTDGSMTLFAGLGQGTVPLTQQSMGTIVEQAGDDTKADSSFDVYFEVDHPVLGLLWNHVEDPLHVDAVIPCVPPHAEYIHPQDQCVPLYPDPDTGAPVAYLGEAQHNTEPPIPTVSEWGLVVMMLLVLAAGTIVISRARALRAQA